MGIALSAKAIKQKIRSDIMDYIFKHYDFERKREREKKRVRERESIEIMPYQVSEHQSSRC